MSRRVLSLIVMMVFAAMPSFADDAAAVFKSKCAMCHGADGAGQTAVGKTMKLRDLRSEEVQKLTDKEILTIITDGKGKMPASKGKLTPAQIEEQVKFIRSLAKK